MESRVPVEEVQPPQAIAETRNTVLLEATDLRLAYGSAVVIDGLNLAIRQGEISGIVGANTGGPCHGQENRKERKRFTFLELSAIVVIVAKVRCRDASRAAIAAGWCSLRRTWRQ